MCGFLGWFHPQPLPWSPEQQRLQSDSLRSISHRGPDDDGVMDSPGVWMGFRRLSILDLSPAGHQPMAFTGGRHTLTFNGEIYNFRELRAQLGEPVLASSGDSAVLGTLLATLPVEQVLERLRGMFAFAWWDAEKRELIAARDPFGIKPLYFRHHADGTLWIGSELKAVHQLSGGDCGTSRRAIAQYLRWGAVQAPETLFEEIQCLPPGHLLRWKDGKIDIRAYHTPSWPSQDEWIIDPVEQRRVVRETLLGSVQAHLIADVPVGVFLSGGLDSTLMTACMRQLGQTDIQAFSIGYSDDAGVPDETDAAERTARHYGCRFTRERVSAELLESKLDRYLQQLDQPSGDALNTWLVSEVAAQHVKVTLSGLGADEWFGGYNYMRLARLADRCGLAASALGAATGSVMRRLNALAPQSIKGHPVWKALFYAGGGAGQSVGDWHTHARSIIPESDLRVLMNLRADEPAAWTLETPERNHLLTHLDERAPDSWLHQMLMMETETYLANTLLRDNDATSMAHSLELRVPLVDKEIFALAGRIPPAAKLTNQGGKRILRDSMADLLPEWILNDQKKKTFTLPLMKWMRHPRWRDRIRDTLQSQACRERGWIDPAASQQVLERYEKSTDNSKAAWPLSQSVWQLFVLESWAQRHL